MLNFLVLYEQKNRDRDSDEPPLIVTSEHPVPNDADGSAMVPAKQSSAFVQSDFERPATVLDFVMRSFSTVIANDLTVGIIARHNQKAHTYRSDDPVADYLFSGTGFAGIDVVHLKTDKDTGLAHLEPKLFATWRDGKIMCLTAPSTYVHIFIDAKIFFSLKTIAKCAQKICTKSW